MAKAVNQTDLVGKETAMTEICVYFTTIEIKVMCMTFFFFFLNVFV